MHRLMLVAVLVAVVLVPATASAWECVSSSCPTICTPPLRYQIGDVPAGLDEAMVVSEVQRAFAEWEAVDCASITFEYAGRVADGADPAAAVVEWTTTPDMATSWGTGFVRWSMDDCIVQDGSTRTVNNGRDFEWGISPDPDSMALDVYSATLRTAGQLLGLANSTDTGAVMWGPYTPTTRTIGLGADDIDGVCSLYGDGPPPRPDGGMSVSACSPCRANTDCESNLCVAFPEMLCAAACTTVADCEDGAECVMAGAEGICTFTGDAAPMCAQSDSGGDAGARDASTAMDAGLDAGGSGGGGGCAVGGSAGATWCLALALLWRRRARR